MRQRGKHLLTALVSAALAVAAVSAFATAAPQTSAVAPANTAKPTITDADFTVGDTGTAHEGTWSGSPTGYSYQWQRCDGAGANCANIAGATAKTYVFRDADIGHRLAVVVTAVNADGSVAASSDATVVVTDNSRPRNSTNPSISGSPQLGQTLTANEGTWTRGVRSFSYQWQRCDSNGNGCFNIQGATGKTYVVAGPDVGNRLRVRVTATNPAGSTDDTSPRTAIVTAPQATACGTALANTTLLPDGTRSVDIRHVALPNRLILDRVSFTPRFIRSRAETITARFHVSEQVGGCSVSGALVYSVAIPFARVTEAPETTTGADGWATLNYRPTARLPLQKGYLLTFFARARKGGENLLGGVSTRRLVSLRIDPTR